MSYQKLSIYQNGVLLEGGLTFVGGQATVVVKYESDDSATTGVGFKVVYNSELMTLTNVVQNTTSESIATITTAITDNSDPQLVQHAAGYASLLGAWPGTGEADLYTLTFTDDGSAAANGASVYLDFSSGNAGYDWGTPNPVPLPSLAVTANDVAENSGENQVIASVDNAIDGEVFSLVDNTNYGDEGNLSGGALSIDANTGDVTLTVNPDFESVPQYDFEINSDLRDGISLPVFVVNADEASPVFSESYVELTPIFDNSGAGQLIYTAQADDSADFSAGITYSLSGIDASAFAINQDTGAVTLVDNPDYEAKNSYTLTVIASDGVNPVAQQQVGLSIVSIGSPPVFDNQPDPVMDENGTLQYSVKASVASDDSISFSLSNDFGGIFTIDPQTGVVSIDPSPDYEAGVSYSFTVVAATATNSSEKTFALTVINLDDTAPTFAEDSVAVAIIENTGENQVVYTAVADDSVESSGGINYSAYASQVFDSPNLVQGAQHLYVSQATLSENDTKLTATVSYNSLDPETAGLGLRVHYDSLALTLVDINDALSADLIFTNGEPTVDADDLDDNATTDTYVDAGWASLYGNWPNDSLPADVLTLTFDVESSSSATDIGLSSLASPVGFSFDGPTQTVSLSSALSALSVDASSGEVTLLENPDHETTPEYDFSVIAADTAGNVSTPQSVSISILDETFAITTQEQAEVNENIGANQVVYSTAVSGKEDGDQVLYSLLTSLDHELGGFDQRFVENNDGSITLQLYVSSTIIDNYPNSVENFDLVLAYNNSEISSVDVSVAPESSLNVIEETEVGEIKIAGVFLPEPDGTLPNIVDNPLVELNFTLNADIASTSFVVSDGLLGVDQTILDQSVSAYYDSRGFTIDGSTGEVSLVEDPNHEARTDYIFSVMASNTTSNQSDIKTVRLTINDIDDSKPVLLDPYLEEPAPALDIVAPAIFENSGANQIIYTAVADDSGDITDGVTYSLVEGSDAAFSIDTTTGEVTLTANPDYEIQSQYTFAVVATDGENNVSDPQTVTLNINNVDDTAPILMDPRNDSMAEELYVTANPIDENSGSGQIIWTADPWDDHDVGDGEINFSLVNDNSVPLHTVISVPDQLPDTQHVYISNSQVSVDGSQVEVTLSYKCDNPLSTGVGFSINYDSSMLVFGNTSDLLPNAIASGFPWEDEFNSDVDDSTDMTLNFGWASIFSDFPGANNVDLATITFDIVDNSSDYAQLNVVGTSSPPYLDFLGQSQQIAIAQSASSGIFSINDLGEVTLLADPDFETQPNYSFGIVATDGAGNESFVQTVDLTINNLDEIAPTITSAEIADDLNGEDADGQIDENSLAGQVIYTATADDSADISTGFIFSLAGADASKFSISNAVQTFGQVTFNESPDYEAQSSYSFDVVATDNENNVSSAKAVTLQIGNVDEVGPTIVSSGEAQTTNENSGAGQIVYTALAEDTDYNGDEVILYSLADSSDDVFSIDEVTGDVTFNEDPDFETKSEYSFTVIAKDVSGNASESKTVSLSIGDVNDFTFSGKVYHWATQTLMEGVSINMHHSDSGEHIETVSSSDAGDFMIDELAANDVIVSVEKDLQGNDNGRLVTSLDALAALKLAVGINPNGMDDTGESQINISPYQFIAADVNKSGKITSADALEILKMAVRVPDATEKEWIFVDESKGLSMDKDSVSWDVSGAEVAINGDHGKNFVGVMLGDVYNSWSGSESSQYMPEEHFIELEDNGVAPMYQWGMSPQAFVFKSSDTAEDLLEMSGAGLVVYTIKATDMEATYSLGDSLDSASFEVNAETGEVVLSADPDFDLQSSYSLEVIATSSKGISISQIVSLAIAERDPSVPFFESADTAPVIDENSGEEQIVYTAVAANIDTGIDAGAITYSLSANNNGVFSIDAESGAVTLAVDPDFEQADSYGFTVVATNAEGNSAELAVTLSVNNMDEAAPIVTSSSNASVNENIGGNQIVYQAEADDTADISNGVSYSLVDNSLAVSEINLPELVADTQHVYVSESTKSEDGSQETIVISYDADNAAATGLGLQIHYNSSVLGVDSLFEVFAEDNIFAFETPVEDTDNVDNDANTDMYLSLGWASLHGTWPGSVPTELASVVFDILDTSSTVSTVNLVSSGNSAGYHFDGQSHDIVLEAGVSVLSIDATSGEVTLLEDPDFEIQSEYSFDVIATDMAGNASTAKVVTLAVNDIDETPRIISDEMAVVLEGNGSNQVVYTATTNIEGATFSLVENTIYPEIDSTSEPLETVISVPELVADTQHVYVSESTKSADGSQITVQLSYLVDNPSLTGVGFALGFDSNVLSLSGVSNVLNGAIASGDLADSGESLTFGWASLFGGWPGSTNSELATITFDILDGATGTTALNIEKTSGTPGYEFDGQAQNLVISAEAQTEPMAPQLSIDINTGVVTLEGDANYELVPNYSFTVTADNGTISASQGVGLVVADALVAFDSYDGTESADVIALGLGSAEVTSDNGEDVYAIAQTLNQWSTSAHTLTDFDSSADTIDVSAALLAAGYTGISPAEGLEENQLNLMTNVSTDVLDLISSDDSSLDNAIGSYFDDATNVLTIFADSDSSAGSSAIESIEISIGDGSTVEEDDLTLAAFIA